LTGIQLFVHYNIYRDRENGEGRVLPMMLAAMIRVRRSQYQRYEREEQEPTTKVSFIFFNVPSAVAVASMGAVVLVSSIMVIIIRREREKPLQSKSKKHTRLGGVFLLSLCIHSQGR
jgi:hypothetical protein